MSLHEPLSHLNSVPRASAGGMGMAEFPILAKHWPTEDADGQDTKHETLMAFTDHLRDVY